MSEQNNRRVPVWDPLLRTLHWALVATVVASWFTRHGFGRTHEWIGYAALAVVVVRGLWGFFGPRHARFRNFVPGPAATLSYAGASVKGRAPRYLGHNPLGGWATLMLLILVFAVCASGWLYTTDRYWGVEWVENLHDGLTWVLIGFIVLHLVGVLWTSLKQRENLVTAMVHGCKRAPDSGDVD